MIQIVENLLLIALGLTMILNVLPKKHFGKYVLWVAYTGLLFTSLDIILGNYRWQMVPAYVFTIVMAILPRFRTSNTKHTHWLKRLLFTGYIILSIVLLAFAAVLPKAFIMFKLPPPAGPYQVGIKDIHVIDKNRPELETEDENDTRELMLRVWYPAEVPTNAIPEPFLREIEPVHEIFYRSLPLPSFILSHLKKIPSHSYLDASVLMTGDVFPVLVFNHGNSFYASQNTLLMEHLASNGYIVMSIDHSYYASWVKFPNGKVITYKQSTPSETPTEKEIEKYKREFETYVKAMAYGSRDHYYDVLSKRYRSEEFKELNDRVQIWADDIAFVLDELEDGKDEFVDVLKISDLEQIGVFGMSLGGATAAKFSIDDTRCKAVINMDGTQYGEGAFSYRLKKPFMMMNADRRLDFLTELKDDVAPNTLLNFEMNDFIVHQSESISYNLVVNNSVHGCFSDFLIMTQNFGSWTGLLGNIEPWAMKGILDDYTLAFFNKHLKGLEEPLLNGYSEGYPDVIKFEIREGDEKTVIE